MFAKVMKKFIFTAFLVFFHIGFGFGQKPKTPSQQKPVKPKTPTAATAAVKPKQTTANKPTTTKPLVLKTAPAKIPIVKKPVSPAIKPKLIEAATEIAEADWKNLSDSLTAENWDKSSRLAREFISRLKADNEKKQLARLRYFYLYSLAGKVFKLSAAKNTTGETAVRDQLKSAVSIFSGEEFVLPPRQFLGDCRTAFNFICAVKDSDRAVRTTATGKSGLEIHSFDYVLFDRKIGFKEFTENKTFLGGTLRKAEFNENPAQPWIMRLVFNKGFARVIVGD